MNPVSHTPLVQPSATTTTRYAYSPKMVSTQTPTNFGALKLNDFLEAMAMIKKICLG